MKEQLLALAIVAALASPDAGRCEPISAQKILTTTTTDLNTGLPSAALAKAIAEWLVSAEFRPAQQLPKFVAVSDEELISMR